jgi:hypothetical protein
VIGAVVVLGTLVLLLGIGFLWLWAEIDVLRVRCKFAEGSIRDEFPARLELAYRISELEAESGDLEVRLNNAADFCDLLWVNLDEVREYLGYDDEDEA